MPRPTTNRSSGRSAHLLQLVTLHARAGGLRAAGPDEQLRQAVVVEHVVREVGLGLFDLAGFKFFRPFRCSYGVNVAACQQRDNFVGRGGDQTCALVE